MVNIRLNRLIDLIVPPADCLRLVAAPSPESAARPLEVDLVRVDEGEDERRREARGDLFLGLDVGLELVGRDDLHLFAVDGPKMPFGMRYFRELFICEKFGDPFKGKVRLG